MSTENQHIQHELEKPTTPYEDAIRTALTDYASNSGRWRHGKKTFDQAIAEGMDITNALELALDAAGKEHKGNREDAVARFWSVATQEEAHDSHEALTEPSEYDTAIRAALTGYASKSGRWKYGKEVFDQAILRGLHYMDALDAALDAAGKEHKGNREDAVARFTAGITKESPSITEPEETREDPPNYNPSRTRTRRTSVAALGMLDLHDTTVQDVPVVRDPPETREDIPVQTPASSELSAQASESISALHYRDVTQFVTMAPTDFEKVREYTSGVRPMDRAEVWEKISTINPKEGTSLGLLLSYSELTPNQGIEIEGKKFMFSDIIDHKGYGRPVAVMYEYTSDSDEVHPRFCYKSNSDGGWRISPGLIGGKFSKGEINNQGAEYGQYVQATRPDASIVALLETKEAEQSRAVSIDRNSRVAENIQNALEVSKLYHEGHYSFSDEVHLEAVHAPGLDAYVSGIGLRPSHDQALRSLESITLPAGFEPDFTQPPIQIYTTEHTLAGKVAIEVYTAEFKGREIEWHIARDNKRRIWVDRIEFADGQITTYGTRAEVITAGALSAKPFDYSTQAANMNIDGPHPDAVTHGDHYVDVTPTLARMPSIRRYKEAKGLLPNYQSGFDTRAA